MTRQTLCLWAGILALLAPGSAWAKQSTVWDLSSQADSAAWNISGWTAAETMPEGLRVSTTEHGGMLRRTPPSQRIDTVRVSFVGSPPQGAQLLLHFAGEAAENIRQLPLDAGFVIVSGNIIAIDFTLLPVPRTRIDALGIGLPAGTSTIIQGIELNAYGTLDAVANAWESFWTFDAFSGLTINFLWGPLLAFTDEASARPFAIVPPAGRTANFVFDSLLVLSLLPVIVSLTRMRPTWLTRKKALSFALGAWLALWIVYDARMGAEFIAAVRKDQRQFLDAPPGERTLRTYDNFYDALLVSAPYLREQERFVFLHPTDIPLGSRVAYFTYPSRPATEEENLTGIRYWFIYRRPDLSVDPQGRLLQGENVIIPTGRLVQQFDSASFLYRAGP